MNKDTQQALEELERELLREEEPKEAPKEEQLVYRNFANGYGRDLRNFASGYATYEAEPPAAEPKEDLRFLWITAGGLLALIVGIGIWWVFLLAGGL